MYQCDKLVADLTIDGVPYRLDSIAECKNISRLRGTKGVAFTNYADTHRRLEEDRKAELKKRRDEQRAVAQIERKAIREFDRRFGTAL